MSTVEIVKRNGCALLKGPTTVHTFRLPQAKLLYMVPCLRFQTTQTPLALYEMYTKQFFQQFHMLFRFEIIASLILYSTSHLTLLLLSKLIKFIYMGI